MLWLKFYSVKLIHIQNKHIEITPAFSSLYGINNGLCINGFIYDPRPEQLVQ